MDPVTAVGVVSAAFQIAQFIGSTVQGLNTLKGKFHGADFTIRLLISKLSTIKAAINQIQDWANYNFDDSPKSVQFLDGLNKSLDGCQAAMDVLSEEVKDLMAGVEIPDGQYSSRLGIRARARATWNHDIMKGHEDMLHGQVQALQLLLLAGQCSDPLSQSRLMEMRENQRLIQRVVDDAATLRGSQSSMASQTARESTGGGTIFDFDPYLDQTPQYQSNPLGQDPAQSTYLPRQRTFETTHPTIPEEYGSRPVASPIQNNPQPAPPTDWGFRPSFQQQAFDEPTDDPYNATVQRSPSVASEPAIQKWLYSTSSSSESQSPKDGASTSKEKRPWQRLKRLTTRSVSKLPSPAQRAYSAGASLGSGHRLRKDRESNLSQSIDFGSWQGLDTPVLVRNAQAGNMLELERLLEDGEDIETRHDLTQRTALAVAAHCGAVKVVAMFIRHDARLDTRDIDLSTPLHLAASRGHYAVMNLLLDEDVDIEATDINSQTPLWVASDRGYHKAAEMLLKRGAKVNARSSNQFTPLHAATKQGDREMVELLLRHNGDIEARDGNSMTALHHACELGYYPIVEFLLQKGAYIEARGKNSMSPLICAAASGNSEVVKLLYKKKAMLRSLDIKKANALHWASRNGHLEIAEYLLAWKMPIHESDSDGLTALHLAVLGLHFSLVDFLLRRNASVETACREGRTPLHCACSSYSSDIVNLLLNAGARAEAPMARDGRQPIHIAAAHGSTDIIETLYARGTNLNVRDAAGDRPLCIACNHGHYEVVEKLLSYGEPLRMPFKNRPNEDSPLCIAARAGHADLVQLLIRKGASVKQRDEYGYIPLRYAAYYAHPEVVQVLLLEGAGLVDYGEDSGGLVMMMNPATLGFSNASDISDERKRKVRDLLNDALQRYENGESDEDGNPFAANFSNNFEIMQRSRLSRRSMRHMLPSSPTNEYRGSSNRDAEMWGGTFKPLDSIPPDQQVPYSPPPDYAFGPSYIPPVDEKRPLASNPAAYDTTQGREFYSPANRIPSSRQPLSAQSQAQNYSPSPFTDIPEDDHNIASIRAHIAQLELLLPRNEDRSPSSPVFRRPSYTRIVQVPQFIPELEANQVHEIDSVDPTPVLLSPFSPRSPPHTHYPRGDNPVPR